MKWLKTVAVLISCILAVLVHVMDTLASSSPETVTLYDFAAGDDMDSPSTQNPGGLVWSGNRTVESTPEGERGMKFTFGPDAPHGDSSSEQRFSFDAAYAEIYLRWRIRIPDNYYHRKIIRITVPRDVDISQWQRDDDFVGSQPEAVAKLYLADPNNQYGIGVSTNQYLWLYQAPDSSNSRWGTGRTITNTSRSISFTSAGRDGYSENNKWAVIWMDGYSSKGEGATAGIETESTPTGGSRINLVPNTGNYSGSDGHFYYQPFISVPEDGGTYLDYILRLRASSTLTTEDGLMEAWVKRDGDSQYQLIHSLPYVFRLPSGEPRGWKNGYLLGWSNSGFEEVTVFYITEVEFFGANRPRILDQSTKTPAAPEGLTIR